MIFEHVGSKLLLLKVITKSPSLFWNKKVFYSLSKVYCLNFYQTLGVSKDADANVLKKAYYAKCKELHPDANLETKVNNDEFVKVKVAYETLKSKEQRRKYDLYLKSPSVSHHDFKEWKTNNAHSSTTDKRNYERYNTVSRYGTGVDVKWSQLSVFDYATVLFVIFLACYIVYSERKLKEENIQPRYSFRQSSFPQHNFTVDSKVSKTFVKTTVDSRETDTTSKDLKNVNSLNRHKTTSKDVSKDPTSKVPKTSSLKNEMKSSSNSRNAMKSNSFNGSGSELVDTFEEIKNTGLVSDEAIKSLRESNKVNESKHNDFTTWKAV